MDKYERINRKKTFKLWKKRRRGNNERKEVKKIIQFRRVRNEEREIKRGTDDEMEN
jgi:hypothetical protein